ncbi:hypothetical protein N657DRAFT_244161 [Parathielavia appendiculata]|uniref:Uncharacterized protein n=1 Tax=Parathielavia appendiculata TaxID=2587402 RepID=A0AAN6TTV7_9PEZI|nr:hypothetical protein N657DRAFT_244161 [Parathielavia appendiculata]
MPGVLPSWPCKPTTLVGGLLSGVMKARCIGGPWPYGVFIARCSMTPRTGHRTQDRWRPTAGVGKSRIDRWGRCAAQWHQTRRHAMVRVLRVIVVSIDDLLDWRQLVVAILLMVLLLEPVSCCRQGGAVLRRRGRDIEKIP